MCAIYCMKRFKFRYAVWIVLWCDEGLERLGDRPPVLRQHFLCMRARDLEFLNLGHTVDMRKQGWHFR